MLQTNVKLESSPSQGVSNGVFCAGEMLDWEAPTGGYLLTACLSSGFVAGRGVARFLAA
jgi:predicted flavoprotein YhiN